MKYLKKATPDFYSYLHKPTGMLFTLREGGRGVYGSGRAWFLKLAYHGNQTLATFCTKDDGHKCYLSDHGSRLYSIEEALNEADRVVGTMIGESEDAPIVVYLVVENKDQSDYSEPHYYTQASDAARVMDVFWDEDAANRYKEELTKASEAHNADPDNDPYYYEVQSFEVKGVAKV